MIVSLLGSSGHMGIKTLEEFLKIPEIDKIKVLLERKEKRNKLVKKLAKENKGRIEIILGDITNKEDCEKLVEGAAYVFNLAAVIPPKSDKRPDLATLANEAGPKNLVEVIEKKPDIKFIDITSVALYGHRNDKHPYERVGNPLLPSVFDVYAANKLRSEYHILESDIDNFVIIRQTAMIYLEMLTSNMSDGLMFHTSFNDPLEWSTAEDSGLLMANIIREDLKGNLNKDNFWRKVFNLGAPKENRVSGYETINAGFRLMGGSTDKFFDPNYNVTRNFHGGFYYDGDKLDELFHYQHDNLNDYWGKIGKKYPYIKMGRICPKGLIKSLAIKRLFKDSNSPAYWYKHNDVARITAFFGSVEAYENQPKKWKDFKLWDYLPYQDLSKYEPIDYGFDIEKSDSEITIEDLRNVAKLHGGKLLSKEFKKGDVYTKLEWENSDGEKFIARPYTVIRGGHWWNPLYVSNTWDFDRLAKKDALFAAYWYDSHKEDENHRYYMNDKYEAFIE